MDLDGLRHLLGTEFLLYALNANKEEDLHADHLSTAQQAAVATLGLVADSVPESDPYRLINQKYRMMQYVADGAMSLPNVLRATCGGRLPEVHHDDPLVELILTVARDAWPGFLLARDPSEPGTGFNSSLVYQHEAGKQFLGLMLADSDFQRLFPRTVSEALAGGRSPDGVHSRLMFSTGNGGTFQPDAVPETILAAAHARMELGPTSDVATYLELVEQVLQEARRLAAGDAVLIPRYTGIASVSFSVDRVILTPLGTVRPIRASDLPYLRQGAPNALQPTAVLETVMEIKLLRIDPWKPGVQDDRSEEEQRKQWEQAIDDFNRYARSAEHTVDLLRLAILLASDGDQLLAALPVTIARPTPLQHGNNETNLYQFGQPSGTGVVDGAIADRIVHWAKRVGGDHAANLEFGIRRLLSAAAMRWDPVDAFVDAVVCWENMLGASPETTFRLSAAMAWLLEPADDAGRTMIFKRIKTLYGIRSKIVHGDKEPPPKQANEQRAEAIQLAIRTMRALYANAELLSIKTAQERGETVLVNGITRAGDSTGEG